MNTNDFLSLADEFGMCSEQKWIFIRPPTESCLVCIGCRRMREQ